MQKAHSFDENDNTDQLSLQNETIYFNMQA